MYAFRRCSNSRDDEGAATGWVDSVTDERGVLMAIAWPGVFDEALERFVQYLQIDTTNPPGNEAPAARWLGSLLGGGGD